MIRGGKTSRVDTGGIDEVDRRTPRRAGETIALAARAIENHERAAALHYELIETVARECRPSGEASIRVSDVGGGATVEFPGFFAVFAAASGPDLRRCAHDPMEDMPRMSGVVLPRGRGFVAVKDRAFAGSYATFARAIRAVLD